MPEAIAQLDVEPTTMRVKLRAIAAKAINDPNSLPAAELDKLCRIAFERRDQKVNTPVELVV